MDRKSFIGSGGIPIGGAHILLVSATFSHLNGGKDHVEY